MKYCFQCRLYLPTDTKFCPRCGRTFNVKYCVPKLHPNALTARFCTQCGTGEMTLHDERPRRKSVRLLAAAAAVGMVGGGVAIFAVAREGALPPMQILGAFIAGALILAVRSARAPPDFGPRE